MNFANILAVAQALLSFGTPALGSNIPLNIRECFLRIPSVQRSETNAAQAPQSIRPLLRLPRVSRPVLQFPQALLT
jgi:hypothetical protein